MDQPAMRAWSQSDPGYLTPNDDSPMLPDAPATMANEDEPLRPYLTQLLHAPPGGLHFDLSDQFRVVTHGEPGGVSEILYDFFHQVTGGGDIKTARDAAIARLNAEASGRSQLGDDCD
jgi:hypothetical protein